MGTFPKSRERSHLCNFYVFLMKIYPKKAPDEANYH